MRLGRGNGKKLKKKQRKRLEDETRQLDPRERYRALTDTLKEALDLVDLADHKARFALIIMGALNAALFVISTRTDVLAGLPGWLRFGTGIFLAAYAVVAVYFFVQAIESLRPRKATPAGQTNAESKGADQPMGIRFYEDILRRDVNAYQQAWNDVRLGQLNAELAVQAHALAAINGAKYAALSRLYKGLQLMTLMVSLWLVLAAYSEISGGGGKAHHGSLTDEIFGGTAHAEGGRGPMTVSETVQPVGVREPSGVAYDARRQRLFVVGDEGMLAELDSNGKVIASHPVKGNLEDVAVYTPTGDLLLLSEKQSELILYDPAQHVAKKKWKLDTAAVLGEEPGDKNQGFEGLAFREEAKKPGGGVFYLTHQRTPAMLLALEFDPSRPGGRLGADVVRGRWPLLREQDLTAVTYVPEMDRLVVIADAKDRLLIVRPDDGQVEDTMKIPGAQQEGLCLDALGRMWIADDQEKVLFRIDGGLEALRTRASSGTAEPKSKHKSDQSSQTVYGSRQIAA